MNDEMHCDDRAPRGLPIPAPEDGDLDTRPGFEPRLRRRPWRVVAVEVRNVFQEGRNRAIVETRLREDGTMEVLITREEGVVHVVTDGAAKLEELS